MIEDPAQVKQNRIRLVDHFKRVYTIIVGLAITEAVKGQFPPTFETVFGPPGWMFGTFFITIVPIFHGGDRSLDIKYTRAEGVGNRAKYLWDVYVLLLTAVLFVWIADSIPSALKTAHPLTPKDLLEQSTLFYRLMGAMFLFDVVVLIIDYWKSEPDLRADLRSYYVWIPSNSILGILCFAVAFAIGNADSSQVYSIFSLALTLQSLSIIVFVAAFIRTGLDYWFSRAFLFP